MPGPTLLNSRPLVLTLLTLSHMVALRRGRTACWLLLVGTLLGGIIVLSSVSDDVLLSIHRGRSNVKPTKDGHVPQIVWLMSFGGSVRYIGTAVRDGRPTDYSGDNSDVTQMPFMFCRGHRTHFSTPNESRVSTRPQTMDLSCKAALHYWLIHN